jgi:EpsI family protein
VKGRALSRRAALGVALAMAASVGAAEAIRPRRRLADLRAPIDLARQVPARFGDWVEDTSIMPVVPDPSVQAKLDALYTQTLARAYVDGAGHHLMLSIAYGSDQTSEATSVHRPEFCYSTQGFRVRDAGLAEVELNGKPLALQRLIASGPRFEPIMYWVTLADEATLPGLGRKLAQLNYGLHGDVPDGMLVRVSTLGLDEAQSFATQRRFISALYAAMDPAIRSRYFGA